MKCMNKILRLKRSLRFSPLPIVVEIMWASRMSSFATVGWTCASLPVSSLGTDCRGAVTTVLTVSASLEVATNPLTVDHSSA